VRLTSFHFLLTTFSIFDRLNESRQFLFMYLLFFSLLSTTLVRPGFLGAEGRNFLTYFWSFYLHPCVTLICCFCTPRTYAGRWFTVLDFIA